MEFLKDYDFALQHHRGKANVVADALSRKSTTIMASLMISEWSLFERLRDLDLDLRVGQTSVITAELSIQP